VAPYLTRLAEGGWCVSSCVEPPLPQPLCAISRTIHPRMCVSPAAARQPRNLGLNYSRQAESTALLTEGRPLRPARRRYRQCESWLSAWPQDRCCHLGEVTWASLLLSLSSRLVEWGLSRWSFGVKHGQVHRCSTALFRRSLSKTPSLGYKYRKLFFFIDSSYNHSYYHHRHIGARNAKSIVKV